MEPNAHAERFAAVARDAQQLANSRGGDYADLTKEELCGLMVRYDEALTKYESGQ